ncbi:Calcineurin-like phosphoesterase [Geosmithia morbida]|uniref:Calcineurin-like phosphoesterase n=1 Tax=Geosmithia morbida TaxID=1094350 RepID=A0A9P4YXL9_9HYPO|nr:Calcineurin-like phosphoesterase [Geosmithia morbida]KAF4124956.1 Calcineurin-like phosphoesterase [Geosmithia morbida]
MSRRYDKSSLADDAALQLKRWTTSVWHYARGPGRQKATAVTAKVLHRLRINVQARRLLSFPHVLVVFWLVILLWGERWVFESKVDDCAWHNWEDWPRGAHPHHLVFVADPQIIDPHSYPGRPWPLSSLTRLITDNYLLRGYKAIQTQLRPDSVFFLGDLFDGGREWKTASGHFVDPKWGKGRSREEAGWVDTWHRKYGQGYWMREYQRFASIFFDHFNDGDSVGGVRPYQRGRKLVASLPGNHDLGFGAQVQVPVRDRFEAFFGDVNRIDVVGNHSIVSVDTVSLSADSSEYGAEHDLTPIHGPVNRFLDGVKAAKRRAVQDELDVWYEGAAGGDRRFPHRIEDLQGADLSDFPRRGQESLSVTADLPTILLTHVPLWREPGTPCGPKREHWPPTEPPTGQTKAVKPDHRNAISVSSGYQYQNVLGEADSAKLLDKVGNVVHVFSGDDHDYCEVVHARSGSSSRSGVREITVKSLSMAMGVPTPGFLMVSLYNPVDDKGNTLPGAPVETLQTHLCLLPNQVHTYVKYIGFMVFSLVVLAVRSVLVPVLNLQPFALGPEDVATISGGGVPASSSSILPIASVGTTARDKDKLDPPDVRSGKGRGVSSSSWTVRTRSSSLTAKGRWQNQSLGTRSRTAAAMGVGPRINVREALYDTGAEGVNDRRRAVSVAVREMWTTTWRVAWMAVFIWVYLARER